MTFENRRIVGIEDIKALSVECNNCKVRLTYSPDEAVKIPPNCPNQSCNVEWHTLDMYAGNETKRPVLLKLMASIMEIRHRLLNSDAEKPQQQVGFRLLLEFDETN